MKIMNGENTVRVRFLILRKGTLPDSKVLTIPLSNEYGLFFVHSFATNVNSSICMTVKIIIYS